jgi:glutaredoxin-like protein
MANKLLRDDIIQQVKDVFDKQLVNPVEVMFFDSQDNCEHCDDTRQLVEEVVAISDKLHFRSYDLREHAELAEQYHVSMAPGLVIAAKDDDQITDYGIRYAGIPSGYEFSSLIQSLVLVSGRDSGLAPETRQALADLKQPVLLQVFVTPT